MSASAVLRRRLAAQLRELRENAGLSQDDMAERLDASVRTVIRADNAETTLGARQLARYLDACSADRETRERLIELGQQARKRGGWWSAYKDLLPGPYLQLEAEASLVRNYEPFLVPGLLQTADYARMAMRVADTPDAERHVEAKMRRQRPVTDGNLGVDALIDEAVLYRLGTDEIAREQIEHLRDMTRLPNVRLRILPWTVGVYPTMGHPFVILSFRSAVDPDVAMGETVGGEKYFDDAEEVMRMSATFDELSTVALSTEGTDARLKEVLA